MRKLKVALAHHGSDIGHALHDLFAADGCIVHDMNESAWSYREWDLAVLLRGTMLPIGLFFDVGQMDWQHGVASTAFTPLNDLRTIWWKREVGAKVVFVGGPNLSKPNETYSAYRCGKAMLEAIVPTLNVEYPQHRFYVWNPGWVRTKFHQQTLDAGASAAANYEQVRAFCDGELPGVSMKKMYDSLRELIL